MATVASTYARAFADVVFEARLDAAKAVRGLPRIVQQFEKELDARLGFAEAQISSARQLGDAERRTLESQIGKTTGKKVRATYALDPTLLGGAVVRIGSTIYDGSVKGQLERIKEAISS